MKFSIAICFGLIAANAITLSPGGPYNTSSAPEKGKINVHLVPHTHDDVGWLKTVDELYLGGRNDIQISAVQFILDSVVDSLSANKDRKFIYVEMAFFSRWWRRQNPEKRKRVMELLESGQLEFINGGWDSNDEATPTFVDIIDQHTMGATYISREFGSDFTPTVGWQVDPFGHSLFQAKAYEKMGMNAWFFGRSDTQDFAIRKATRQLETIHSGILAGSMDGYGPPKGFDWNIFSADEPLNDDEYLGEVNIERRVEAFVKECMQRAEWYNDPSDATQNIMLTMGSDFEYEYAHTWFSNMDKLIHYVNLDGRVNVFYSSPSIYTKSRSEQHKNFPVKSDYDWFPYCDSDDTVASSNGTLLAVGGHAYWTGYFTSRPLLKRLVREASSVLELCRLAELVYVPPSTRMEDKDNPVWLLWEALSVVQHHDGVSGTARQLVTDDYTRRLQEGMHACLNFIERFTGNGEENLFTSMVSSSLESPISTADVEYYFAYYNSSTGNTTERAGQASGAYIFRPDCPEGNVAACRPSRLPANTSWVHHEMINNTIHWRIGPVPPDHGGKEIVLIIQPKKRIENNGVFFTDSNAYQWIRREVNKRPTWSLTVTDPVSGNYYPVTAGIAILDHEQSLVVSTDRSVGGSSLENNQIEIMLHRRILKDDDRGVGEPLNETTTDGVGIVVSGATRVALIPTRGNTDTVPVRVPIDNVRPPITLRGNLGKIREYMPHVDTQDVIVTHFHRIDVPHICRLGRNDCVLVRLAHRDVDNGGRMPVVVNLEKMFKRATILNVTETVLHAGQTVSDSRRKKIDWLFEDPHIHSIADSTNPGQVVIRPGDIKTFILEIFSRNYMQEEVPASVIEVI